MSHKPKALISARIPAAAGGKVLPLSVRYYVTTGPLCRPPLSPRTPAEWASSDPVVKGVLLISKASLQVSLGTGGAPGSWGAAPWRLVEGLGCTPRGIWV